MDEAVINGANLFFAPQFHIDSNSGNASKNEWLLGLVNSAPYVRIYRYSLSLESNFLFCRSFVALYLVAGSQNPSITG